jgi:membrane protease YdiL (CAAX protease family)
MTTPEVQTSETSPPPRWSRVSAILSWLVIFGCVGALVYRNVRVQPPGDVQRLMDDQRARLVGLLAVQLKSMSADKNNPLGSQTKESQEQLIRDMEREARTPEDHVRIAILIGELQGGEAAIAALGKVTPGENSSELTHDLLSLVKVYDDGPEALESAERDRLVKRYGALGRIALAYGVPPDMEPRQSLQSEAFSLVIRLVVVGLGFLGLAIASLALVVLTIVWATRGKLRPMYVPGASVGAVFLEAFAIYLVLFIALGFGLRFARWSNIQWMWLALLILPVLFGWVIWRGVTVDQLRNALGWHAGRGFIREIAAGVGGYIAGIPLIIIGGMITYLIVKYTGVRVSSPIVQELKGGALHIAGVYAVACIFAPIMEETMFRGALFHHLRQRWGWAVSAPLVAVIFALLHPQGWVALPALGAIAVGLAALREWRGSLIAPIVAHACNNFIVLTVTLLVLE